MKVYAVNPPGESEEISPLLETISNHFSVTQVGIGIS